MKKNLLVLTCVIVATLSSCQDPGLLLPGLDKGEARSLVSSITQGSILQVGDQIPIALTNNADSTQNPDTMTVRMLDSTHAADSPVIPDITFSQQQLQAGNLPSLTVPALNPGSYQLVFLLYRQGNLLRQETTIFFAGMAKPDLRGIIVQPGTLTPGGDGLLNLLISLPDGSSAFIRWSTGTAVLKTGLTTLGGKQVVITAPKAEGVYTYRADIFPLAPVSGGDYSFKSPYFVENRVVVAHRASPSSTDIGPDSDFTHLLHLQGTLTDTGWAQANGIDFTLVGDRRFEQMHDSLGYILGGGSSIHYAQALIPDFTQHFPALAVCLRLVPLNLNSGVLYRSRSTDGSTGLELTLTQNAELSLRIWNKTFDRKVVVPSPLEIATSIDLQIGLASSESATQVLLSSNGQVLGSALVDNPVTQKADLGTYVAGETEIGQAAGPQFLLDEYGIYQPQKNEVQDAYFLTMQYRYGKAIPFAQAFGSGAVIDQFKVEGDVRVEHGTIIIPPGGALTLSSAAVAKSAVGVEIVFATNQKGKNEVVRLEAKDMLPGLIDSDGMIVQGPRNSNILGLSLNPLRFSLQKKASGYLVAGPELSFPLLSAQAQPITISVDRNLSGLVAVKLPSTLGAESSTETGIDEP